MDLGNSRDRFDPATSEDASGGVIVLPTKFLAIGDTGCPGIFLFSGAIECINNPPYDLSSIKGTLFPKHNIVRYCFCPSLEITIIPTSLRDLVGSELDGTKVQNTKYFLQYFGDKHELSGYRVSVKFDFMVWHTKKWARRFHIDGAALIDPNFEHLLLNFDTPVCLLGMDFMIKHPHLLFEPRYDSWQEPTFELAEDPFVDRSYDVTTNAWNEVVAHIESHHNKETGNIGCGVFFKSGSIFNSFCGVSKRDMFGNKLGDLWEERGILAGIVKALHIVETLPTESNQRPTAVIIRTSSTNIEGMLAPIKWFATRIRPPYEDQSLQDLEAIFPPTIRDIIMYYYHNFVCRNPGFKIKFQYAPGPENSGGALAARLLATAGSEMGEFCMKLEGNGSQYKKLWGSIGTEWLKTPDITPLDNHTGVKNKPLYASIGSDGSFLIEQDKAHAATKAADTAGQSFSVEDAVSTPNNSAEKNVVTIQNKLAGPRMYEYQPPTVSDYSSSSDILNQVIAEPSEDSTKQKSSTRLGTLERNKSVSLDLPEYEKDWSPPIADCGTDSDSNTKKTLHRQGKKVILRQGEMLKRKGVSAVKTEAILGLKGNDFKALETWKTKPEETRVIGHTVTKCRCGYDCECRLAGDCRWGVGFECGAYRQHKSEAKQGPRPITTEMETPILANPKVCGDDCECRVGGECRCGLECRCRTNHKRGPKSITKNTRDPVETKRAFILQSPDIPEHRYTDRSKMLTEINRFQEFKNFYGSTRAGINHYLEDYQNPWPLDVGLPTCDRLECRHLFGPSPMASTPYDNWRPIPIMEDNGRARLMGGELKVGVSGKPTDVGSCRDWQTVKQLMEHKECLGGHKVALQSREIPYTYRLQPNEAKLPGLPKHPGPTENSREMVPKSTADQKSPVLLERPQTVQSPEELNYPLQPLLTIRVPERRIRI